MLRCLLRMLILAGMAAGAAVVIAPPAHATAHGCSQFSAVPYVGIPAGVLCFNVYGSGENITSMDANWTTPTLCDWRIDWVIYKDGKVWWRDNGPRRACHHIQDGRTRD